MPPNGVLLILAYLFTITLLISAFLILRRKKSPNTANPAIQNENQAQNAAVAPPRDAAARLRARMQRGRAQTAQNTEENGENGENAADRALSVEERRLQQRFQAAEARQAAIEAQRRVQDQKEAALAAKTAEKRQKQAEKALQREQREQAEMAALKEIEENERKRAEAEFDEWKDAFSIESGGNLADSGENDTDLMEKFVNSIKNQKIAPIDALANEFGLKTVVVVERIKELEKEGRMTGIFDERGKYIFITENELKQISEWIVKKGRISLADLVREANRVIDWSVKVETESIEEENEENPNDSKQNAPQPTIVF